MKIITTILYFALFILTTSFCVSQKRVALDNYYNHELNAKTAIPFHYLWEDKAMSGFSELGSLFQKQGAKIETLRSKPTKINLKGISVYIIVDPDTDKDTQYPNYMDENSAQVIADWVKLGGRLLLLTNDEKNTELDSFNILASKFGIHYNKELLHPENSIKGEPRNFNSCASVHLPNHKLFNGVSKIFLKEIAPISCTHSAKAILVENNKVLIAEAKCGKGYVLAIGDPWLYNEYIDHLILPADFDNFKAAINLVKLMLN